MPTPKRWPSRVFAWCIAPGVFACAGTVEGEPYVEPGVDPASEDTTEDDVGPSSPDTPDLRTGAELYTATCAACHGADGEGTELAPEIQHPTPDFAEWVVRNGFTGAYDLQMPPFSEEQLPAEALSRIVEYLRGLPQPTTGEGLFLDYCGNCHGGDGLGGPSRKEIAGKDDLLEDVRRGKGGTNYAERDDFMPGWSADELSSEQLGLMQDFVGSLPD